MSKRLTGAVLNARVIANLRAELNDAYGLPMTEYKHEVIDVYSLGSDMQPILTVRFTRPSTKATMTISDIYPNDDGSIATRSADIDMR